MQWIYWARLYESKFQANCLKTRLEQDWWLNDYESPEAVEVLETKTGKFCVRFTWERAK